MGATTRKGATAIDDVVIVGGGLAGLFCALKLAPRPVTILTGAPIGEGASSAWAQGGIAAAISEGDTWESHLADTLAAGAGTVDEKIAGLMVREAAERITDLLRFGVPFDRDLEGKLATGREAAHSARRIIHVRGDMAGRAIMEALIAAVRATPSIRVLENFKAESLIVADKKVAGVIARPARGRAAESVAFPARAVVMTSGGIGGLYAVTTNPIEAHGSGLAMAARAGAILADCEFVQFHPTALDVGGDPAPLVTEALRGEGAILLDRAGNRLMQGIHPDLELAPRDIVARAIFRSVRDGHGAFLDAREAVGAAFPEAFPTVFSHCQRFGIDPRREVLPVIPAEHYHMGGILTDADGRSSLDGLWAAGEVASTGVHGANRLASNSLLEAVVFAARVAEDIHGLMPAGSTAPLRTPDYALDETASEPDLATQRSLRETMSRCVGVERDRAGLEEAVRSFARMEAGAFSLGFRNMATAALLVAASALQREESRGGHYRTDFPHTLDQRRHRSFTTLRQARALAATLGTKAA